jgi:uncharacterized membrane protein
MEMDNIIVAKFDDPAKAYQALSVLKQAAAAGRVVVKQAGVVERMKDGAIKIPEGADNRAGLGIATGSLVGMLIGIIGGPIGLLLGWGTGALVGGVFDAQRTSTSESALGQIGRTIPPGSTALIADVHELATEVLDGEMKQLGGELVRRPTNDVLAEVAAAQDAAQAAAEQAERVMREQKKEQRAERRESRLESLKALLRRADEAVRAF